MSIETDSHGRLYLSAKLRQQYGEKFHVVTHNNRIELIPIAEDPLRAVQDAAGNAFEDTSVDQLREEARNQAKADAEAGLARGKCAAENSDTTDSI